MLARANRVVAGDDFRAAVRRGRRVVTPIAVYHMIERSSDHLRFGFIVSRAVGNAVVRNRLRRQLRAIVRQLVDAGARAEDGACGADVVIRVLPAAAGVGWDSLRSDVRSSLEGRVGVAA